MLLLPSLHDTHPCPHHLSGVPPSHLPIGQQTARKPLEVKAVATPSRCVEEVPIGASNDWRLVICCLGNAKARAGEATVVAHSYFHQSVGAERSPGNCQI